MARVIYRYEYDVSAPPLLTIRNCMQIARASALSDNWVEFWAVVDLNGIHIVSKQIEIIGTGMELGPEWSYEATTQRTPAGLVWHVVSKII